MERMEKTGQDFGREATVVWKPPTMRSRDIERPQRKQNYVRWKWMYRK
jgi:hypothetical protein